MESTKAAFDKYVKVIKKEYAMIGMKRVMSKMRKTNSSILKSSNRGGGG
jgi:hypothetical protein